jgi:Flp pilus assembly protein TadD
MLMRFNLIEKQIEHLCATNCHQDVIELGDDLIGQGVDLRNGWESYGLSLLQAGFEGEGIAAIERATLVKPLQERTRIALAVAYGRTGKRELAKELLIQLGCCGRLDAMQHLQLAAGFDAINEPRLAMEACRRAWKLAPDIARIYYDMAYYALRCKSPNRNVESLLRKSVELEADNADFCIGLMSFLRSQGRLEEACDVVESCSADSIARVACRCCVERVVDLMVKAGRSEAAEAWMRRLSILA